MKNRSKLIALVLVFATGMGYVFAQSAAVKAGLSS
jgi:hypothetical protein